MHVSILEACHLLKEGHVVGVPTETVYGLAASLYHPKAIEHVFTLKNRPPKNPLIIHLSDISQISAFNHSFPPYFENLANAFWPGPLTIVLPIAVDKVPEKVRASLTTAAFRIPANAITRELLTISGPLVMPSANLSGRPSSTLAAHVEHDFGSDFPVIDGGECSSGIESTIVMHQEGVWKILRQGILAAEDFSPILGYQPEITGNTKGEAPLCPGQLYRHYAPKATLIPVKTFPTDLLNAVVIGFADRHYPSNYRLIPLSSSENPEEAAHNLYAILRQIDEEQLNIVYIDIDFPDTGLWRTLKERISKATSK